MITRQLSQEIKVGLQNFPAVALLGPRQIGKSTLAQTLAKQTKKKVVLLDLEKKSDQNRLIDAEAFFAAHQDELVIIDEAQIMPELFTALRPAIDEFRKPGRFLLLGSASPQLVKGVSESLAGRVQYLELSSINIKEAEKSKIDINTLWLRGGFPLSLIAKNAAASMAWRQQLIRSFVERDLSLLFGTEISINTVRNFWQMLAHHQGGLWNAHTMALSLGITGPTVKRYLQFLTGAFLTRELAPWFVNTEKRLVKTPKVYVRDSGLLHALLDIPDYKSILGHPVAGGSWEGFVIEQIIAQLPDTIRPFFYRTHHGAEADLVLIKGLKAIAAIEIKLNNAPTITKGFYQSLTDLKLASGYVVTPSAEPHTINNVEVVGLAGFVNKVLPRIVKR